MITHTQQEEIWTVVGGWLTEGLLTPTAALARIATLRTAGKGELADILTEAVARWHDRAIAQTQRMLARGI